MVTLSFGLGWKWGAYGAAIAVVVARISILSQYISETAKIQLKVDWQEAFVATMLAGTVMGLVALLCVNYSIWLAALIPATLAYFVVLRVLTRHRLLDAWKTLRGCATGAF